MSKQKKDRNTRLIRFVEQHPDMSTLAIGKIFRISGARVRQIKKFMENIYNDKQQHSINR